MTGVQTVQAIVEILVAGITDFAQGLGQGILAFAKALAYESDGNGGQQISVYFILVLAFAAVALVVGITSRIFLWLSSLGRN